MIPTSYAIVPFGLFLLMFPVSVSSEFVFFDETKIHGIKSIAKDAEPPVVKILTTELREGKNIFKVRIVDESKIQLREIRYVTDGKIQSDMLTKGQKDEYKGLVTVHGPSAVIIIEAGDVYGNNAKVVNSFKLLPETNFFSNLFNFFNDLWKYSK